MHSAMAMAAQGVASKLVPDVSMHSHALMTKRISCSAAQLPNSHPKILQIRTTRDFRVSDRDSHCNIDWSWRREFKSISLNQAAKPTRRGKCCAVAAGGEVMEGDVVEYPLPEYVRSSGLYGARSHGLGAVSEIVADDSSSATLCHIEPLVMVEPPEPSWVVDERQEMVVVHLSEVRRLEAWLSMRMIDDRISNPHGEHAEYLWLVEEPISDGTGSPMYDEATTNHGH